MSPRKSAAKTLGKWNLHSQKTRESGLSAHASEVLEKV